MRTCSSPQKVVLVKKWTMSAWFQNTCSIKYQVNWWNQTESKFPFPLCIWLKAILGMDFELGLGHGLYNKWVFLKSFNDGFTDTMPMVCSGAPHLYMKNLVWLSRPESRRAVVCQTLVTHKLASGRQAYTSGASLLRFTVLYNAPSTGQHSSKLYYLDNN